ncbi:hypothetical protein CGRA01v4_13708 [Colletotrichum graminicola]|nr:hypothetical protein CGRA01v4_13708 [Colletotrichum graminicola]
MAWKPTMACQLFGENQHQECILYPSWVCREYFLTAYRTLTFNNVNQCVHHVALAGHLEH